MNVDYRAVFPVYVSYIYIYIFFFFTVMHQDIQQINPSHSKCKLFPDTQKDMLFLFLNKTNPFQMQNLSQIHDPHIKSIRDPVL